MKKLLLILLCLIVVTGCGNEVEQQPNKPNIKQEEVEIKKYITIKIKLNEDCDPTIKESCKVKDYKVENDIKNIFKDLDLNGSTYCLMNKQFCSEDIFNTSTLKQIYDIAIKNNLNFIPDYRYLVDDKYKTIREIIIKPLDELKFDEKGLIPIITQDFENGQVLMLAYANRQAMELTLQKGTVHYYSRSRKQLWHKGETSGHFQYVKEILYDCDADAVLIKIEQKGAACHTGKRSCFNKNQKGEEIL